MLRLDGPAFGAPRAAGIEALRAEGIPCSAGYGFSLPQQPIFRAKAFGPYLQQAGARLDYSRAAVPNSDLICREQGIWLEHALLLGRRSGADDIAWAFEKIHDQRTALSAWFRQRPARRQETTV